MPAAVARSIRETCILGGEPYLVAPPSPDATLFAASECTGGPYTLHIGHPLSEPEPPTWEEFLESRSVDLGSKRAISNWFAEEYGYEEDSMDSLPSLEDPIDGCAYEQWLDWDYQLWESPMATAYRYLEDLPLANENLEREQALGQLRFIEGPFPGSNLTYVEAPDLPTLACLQERLKELQEGVTVKLVVV